MANDTRESEKRGAKHVGLDTALSFVERTTKPFAVFLGTSYVCGYVVTATRLAQHGVPTTRLLDAQYFVAGFLPGLLLALTVLVFASAFFYKSDTRNSSLKWIGLLLVVLFVVTAAMEFFVNSFNWSDFRHSLLNSSYIAAKFLLGELAIWFLIVGWRTKYFLQLSKTFRAMGQDSHVWISIVLCVALVAIALYQIPKVGWMVYNGLPQSYGGGKPLRVELYVDSNKVPAELLASQSGMNQGPTARTIPLKLILKTSAEYIVGPEDGSQRIWVIKTDVVHAEFMIDVSSP